MAAGLNHFSLGGESYGYFDSKSKPVPSLLVPPAVFGSVAELQLDAHVRFVRENILVFSRWWVMRVTSIPTRAVKVRDVAYGIGPVVLVSCQVFPDCDFASLPVVKIRVTSGLVGAGSNPAGEQSPWLNW